MATIKVRKVAIDVIKVSRYSRIARVMSNRRDLRSHYSCLYCDYSVIQNAIIATLLCIRLVSKMYTIVFPLTLLNSSFKYIDISVK